MPFFLVLIGYVLLRQCALSLAEQPLTRSESQQASPDTSSEEA